MRSFTRTFILIIGFTVAIVAVSTEQKKASVALGNCFETTAPSAPLICQ